MENICRGLRKFFFFLQSSNIISVGSTHIYEKRKGSGAGSVPLTKVSGSRMPKKCGSCGSTVISRTRRPTYEPTSGTRKSDLSRAPPELLEPVEALLVWSGGEEKGGCLHLSVEEVSDTVAAGPLQVGLAGAQHSRQPFNL
jgi:hypothetical protein